MTEISGKMLVLSIRRGPNNNVIKLHLFLHLCSSYVAYASEVAMSPIILYQAKHPTATWACGVEEPMTASVHAPTFSYTKRNWYMYFVLVLALLCLVDQCSADHERGNICSPRSALLHRPPPQSWTSGILSCLPKFLKNFSHPRAAQNVPRIL